ncbi:MAG TPA: hypothetical protein VFZ53_07060 [Polyangiaceae bacterium]
MVACAAPANGDGASGAGSTANSGGTSGAATDGGSGAGSPESGPTWCEASAVLERKCQRCHHEPPENGAPFALVTYDDTQMLDRRGVPRYERMLEAIESGFMPATFIELAPSVEPLEGTEKALLVEWLSRGADPVGGTSCPPSRR